MRGGPAFHPGEAMRLRGWAATVAVIAALLPALGHRPAGRAVDRPSARHVRGAVHVHSGLSLDGGPTVEAIARAAAKAGLDLVVLTDHDTDAAWAARGWHGRVLVVVGMERTAAEGHALVLGASPLAPVPGKGAPAADVARDAARRGGFLVGAHPISHGPGKHWTGSFQPLSAIEVVNFLDRGAWPALRPALAASLVRLVVDPRGTLLREFRFSPEPLRLWDRLLAERPVAGLLGSDAHGGFRAPGLFVPVPGHELVFRLASQHLLLATPFTGEAEADTARVLEALRVGRGYVAFDEVADADGFRFEAESGGRRAEMGGALAIAGHAVLRVASGQPEATVRLLHDGREVARGAGLAHATAAPGAYRAEAYFPRSPAPHRPWIIANPIRLEAGP
jgi:hypothetical protein